MSLPPTSGLKLTRSQSLTELRTQSDPQLHAPQIPRRQATDPDPALRESPVTPLPSQVVVERALKPVKLRRTEAERNPVTRRVNVPLVPVQQTALSSFSQETTSPRSPRQGLHPGSRPRKTPQRDLIAKTTELKKTKVRDATKEQGRDGKLKIAVERPLPARDEEGAVDWLMNDAPASRKKLQYILDQEEINAGVLSNLVFEAFRSADDSIKKKLLDSSDSALAKAFASRMRGTGKDTLFQLCHAFKRAKELLGPLPVPAPATPREGRMSKIKTLNIQIPTLRFQDSPVNSTAPLPPRKKGTGTESESLQSFVQDSVVPHARDLERQYASDPQKYAAKLTECLRVAIADAGESSRILKASDDQFLAALRKTHKSISDPIRLATLVAFRAAKQSVAPSSSSSSAGAPLRSPRKSFFSGFQLTSTSRSSQTHTPAQSDASGSREDSVQYSALDIVRKLNVRENFLTLAFQHRDSDKSLQKELARMLEQAVIQSGDAALQIGFAFADSTEIFKALCDQSDTSESTVEQKRAAFSGIAKASTTISRLLLREATQEAARTQRLPAIERIRQCRFYPASEVVEALVSDALTPKIKDLITNCDNPGWVETELTRLLRHSLKKQSLDVQQSYTLTTPADVAAALLNTLDIDQPLANSVHDTLIRAINGAVDRTGFSFKDGTSVSIGGYEFFFSKELAKGGFGSASVYQNKSDAPVVVKTLRSDLNMSPEEWAKASKLFAEEYMTQAKAYGESDSVVKPLGAARSPDGTLAIVMEYCPYGTQQEVIEKLDLLRKLSTPEQNRMLKSIGLKQGDLDTVRAYLAHQNFKALLHLNRMGVIHFDLKPANFYIGMGNVKAGDFGTAFLGSRKYIHTPVEELSYLDPVIAVHDSDNRVAKSKIHARYKKRNDVLNIGSSTFWEKKAKDTTAGDFIKELRTKGSEIKKLKPHAKEERKPLAAEINKERDAAVRAKMVEIQVLGPYVDTWSLGVSLIQMFVPDGTSPVVLVGQPSSDSIDQMRKYLKPDTDWMSLIKLPAALNPHVRMLIQGCLHPVWTQRITPEDALKSPLFAPFADEEACREAHGMVLTLVQKLWVIGKYSNEQLSLHPPAPSEKKPAHS